jgi:hypothetical protein
MVDDGRGGTALSDNDAELTALASSAAAAAAEQDAFTFVAEAADIARDHAEALADAAMRGDHARVRLHACQLSRVVRSSLVTVDEILEAERSRA